jgi:FemAB-related protein (PEP-CTERM system-associated)
VVRSLEPGEEKEWDRFVLSEEPGTLFHLCGWQRVVERAMGHRCIRLVACRESRLTGVFPISHVRNRLFGDCLVSSPLAVYGGICSDDRDSYFALLTAGSELANRLNVKYLEMRNATERFHSNLPNRDLYVTFTQNLTPGAERLLQRLPRDTRYMIRKSMKAGLEWTEDLSIDEFYEIYARSVHRLGTPVFSKQLFAVAREEFPNQCRLFGVRKGKKAIAGVFCLYYKDQVLPYYGGALAEFNCYAPNNFMYWNLIAQSCREGYRHFDFGRSKRGTGSFQFKSTWSMEVRALPYRYLLVRSKAVPQMSPVDQKFQLPVTIWKRMPFSWTKLLGPIVIRRIPSV